MRSPPAQLLRVWGTVCILGGLAGDLWVQLSGVSVAVCILGGPDGDLGPAVWDRGCRLHFGRLRRRPGGLAVRGMGCRLHFERRPGVQLSVICIIICIWDFIRIINMESTTSISLLAIP